MKFAIVAFFWWVEMPYTATVMAIAIVVAFTVRQVNLNLARRLRNRFREIPINIQE